MPDENIQTALDYLGLEQPLTIGGKATLPVGGAPAGAAAGPTGPGGMGAPGGGVGNSVGGGGSATSSVTGGRGAGGALPLLQGGLKVADVARKLGNLPGTPLRAPSSDILEGAPDTPFEGGRGFSAPSPTFQGPDSGALSGADASLAAAAEQGATDLSGGGLGAIGTGLNLAGQIPGAINTIGNPNLSAGEKATSLGFQGLRAGLGFSGAGAAAIPLVEGVEGLVNKLAFGGGGYSRTREGEQRSLGDAMPDALDAILTADTPEGIAAALQGLGGPQVGVTFRDPANPLGGVAKFGGVHLTDEQVAPFTQAINDAVEYQQAILAGLKAGNPQALALYDAAKQASMARTQQRQALEQQKAADQERLAMESRADAP